MGMFSEFVDDLNSTQVNKGLLNYFLNQVIEDVPENFGSYKKFSEDSYILEPNKDIQITFNFKELPSELKKKGIKNSEMLGKYLYSTQQSMSFETAKMSSGGYEIDPRKVILEPFNENPFPIKSIDKFFIIPRKFPKPHPVEFTFGGKKEIFLLERQPSEDYSKVWIKSIDKKPLIITFLLDEETGKMNMSINFTIRRSTSIDEALKYSEYADSFFKHDFQILGESIPGGDFSSKFSSQTPFLELVKAVEQYYQDHLDASFLFDPNVELSHDEYITMHKLYYSFILNKSFKSHNSIDSITLQKDSIDTSFIDNIKKQTQEKEQYSAFMSTRSEKVNLLGKELYIEVAENFNGISMISYTEVEDKIVVSIKQHENFFSSSIYFLDKENTENKITEEIFNILLKPEDIKFR